MSSPTASSRRLLLAWVLLAAAGCGGESPTGTGTAAASASGSGGGGGSGLPDPPAAGLGDWPCDAGELELEDGTCLPAGIPPEECGQGFQPTADRSCEPILPAAPCPDGEMALPGETTCRPVAPCAAGTWGDIPVDASTQFVDGAYPGGDSDGSAAKPWTSVQMAIDSAADGAIVAVAEGTYAEHLLVEGKSVRLWGRCPSLVRILSSGEPAIRIESAADGSEIRDMAFESPAAVAVHVGGGSIDVLIDRIWVQGASLIGVDVEGQNPGASLTRSLIEDSGYIGVFGYGAKLLVEDTEIRGVAQAPDGTFGTGIRVFDDGVPCDLTVRRSIIAGAFGAGIFVIDSVATVEDTVITDIEPQSGDPDDGFGIYVDTYPDFPPATLELSRSYIARTHHSAVSLVGSDGNVRTTVLRDVSAPPARPASFGILARAFEGSAAPTVGVRSSVVELTRFCGIAAAGANATIEASIVRDTEPTPGGLGTRLDVGGRGICVEAYAMFPRGATTVAGCRVERTHELAIGGLGVDLAVEGTLVSDVAKRETDGMLGRGITFQPAIEADSFATGLVRRSRVERAHEHGILVLDADVTIESTLVRDTQNSDPMQYGETTYAYGRGIAVQGYTFRMAPATATLDQVVLEENQDAELVVAGADVELKRSVLRGSKGGLDGLYGDGLVVMPMPDDIHSLHPKAWLPTSVLVSECVIEDNLRAGIANFWADVTMGGTWLSCNAIDLNGEKYDTFVYEFEDSGGNTCVCNGKASLCKALTSGFVPPSPATQ